MGKSSPKIKESVFTVEKDSNTTVFSDPKSKQTAEKPKKKKWIPIVIALLVCVVVVIPFIAKALTNSKTPGNSIEPISKRSRIVKDENISDKAKLLFEAINHNPEDLKANERISGLIGVTSYCGAHELSVYKGEDGGYTLCFDFEYPHSTSTDTVFYDLMLNYSVAFMALVDDLTAVEWTSPAVDGSGKETSEKITFDNVKEYLNDSPKEYAKSTKTVQFMLNEHGLNDLSD